MSEKPLALRCYCCGRPLGAEVALVTMTPKAGTDRVFTMLPRCAPRVDAFYEVVRRVPAGTRKNVTRITRQLTKPSV